MDEPALRRGFLVGSAGLCLVLGVVLGASALILLAFAHLALLVLGFFVARRRLSGLGARREMEGSAFEDESIRVVVALENHGRRAVSLVEAVDSFGPAHADRQVLLDPGPLAAGCRRRLSYRTACSRLWGVYVVGPLSLSVSDPLGLFAPRRAAPTIEAFDLFPRVHPVAGLERLGSRASFAPSEPTSPRPGQSALYLGVRDFRPGDDVRRVHWPATARRGVPMVRELEVDLTPHFTLFLDLERDHRAGTGQKSTLEYVVRTAACLLASAARRGDLVQMFGEPSRPLLVPPGRGELHLARALDALIRVRQDGDVPLLDLVERHRAEVPRGSTAALLSASLFLDLDRLAEVFADMTSRGVRPLVVAVDKDSFLPIDRRPRARVEVAARHQRLIALARAHEAPLAVLSSGDDLEAELSRPGWLEAS